MVCIYCSGDTKVANSRLQKRTNRVWRRRRCLECGAVFSTEEQAVTDKSIVFKDSNVLEPFSREKLLLSVYDTLRHRKTAVGDATALCDTIWSKAYLHITDGIILRDDLVRITAATLQRFDRAGATAYLAFHPI